VKKQTFGLIGAALMTWILSSGFSPFFLLFDSGARSPKSYRDPGRPQDDYMSALLARNADPIGLKENPELQELLNQPTIKWAVRSAAKHVLD
jgi:hypothetical protein